ncbi:MAG: leucine-rich repeat domain-containing protein [Clostridia bacterium]|nr:leucine-rich repeat domain-containing protein [Clostridia bacterium]
MKRSIVIFLVIFCFVHSLACVKTNVAIPMEQTEIDIETEENNPPSEIVVESEEELKKLLDQKEQLNAIKVLTIRGVERIPSDAFRDCQELEKLELGDDVLYVDNYAFKGCIKLQEIIWSNNLKEIGYNAFRSVGIQELSFPDTCELTIDDYAFADCEQLERVSLGNGVVRLKTNFTNCAALKEISFSPLMKTIDAEECSFCPSLFELVIPANVQVFDSFVGINSGIRRFIFEGTPDAVCALVCNEYPELQYIVFLGQPPLQDEEIMEDAYPENYGLVNNGSVCIYYLESNREYWAPHGEEEWNGFHIIPINSIEDLPPIW